MNFDLSKTLKDFISKDPTRFYINGVYHDKDKKAAVATDGHRLFFCPEEYQEELAGKIITPLGVVIGNDDADFPDYEAVVPKSHDYKVEVYIPEWVGRLSSKNMASAELAGIHINLGLINKFAGQRLLVEFSDDLSPMVFKPITGEFWFALIMPLREDAIPNDSLIIKFPVEVKK